MYFNQSDIYLFTDNEFDDFISRLQNNQLTDKDLKLIADIMKSYQSFFKDFIFGKMTKAQFKKQVEKLIKEHGNVLPKDKGESPEKGDDTKDSEDPTDSIDHDEQDDPSSQKNAPVDDGESQDKGL